MQSDSPPSLRLLPKDAIAKRLLLNENTPVPLSPQDCGHVVSCRVSAEAALKRKKAETRPSDLHRVVHVQRTHSGACSPSPSAGPLPGMCWNPLNEATHGSRESSGFLLPKKYHNMTP